jgi:hypothetical protein
MNVSRKENLKVKRVDKHGKKLGVGDKVRVAGIPADVLSDSYDEEELETRTVFERSLGRLFPVNSFDDDRVELEVGEVMGKAKYLHSIWLEPKFIELVAKSKSQRGKVSKTRPKRKRVLK